MEWFCLPHQSPSQETWKMISVSCLGSSNCTSSCSVGVAVVQFLIGLQRVLSLQRSCSWLCLNQCLLKFSPLWLQCRIVAYVPEPSSNSSFPRSPVLSIICSLVREFFFQCLVTFFSWFFSQWFFPCRWRFFVCLPVVTFSEFCSYFVWDIVSIKNLFVCTLRLGPGLLDCCVTGVRLRRD